jgi:hypothetical protein
MIKRVPGVTVVLALLLAGGALAAVDIQGVRFAYEPFAQSRSFHGYWELRVRVENLSPSKAREVEVGCHSASYPQLDVTKRVAVAPGASARVVLYVPYLEGGSYVEIKGRVNGEERQIENSSLRNQTRGNKSHLWLVSRSLNADHLDQWANPEAETKEADKAPGRHGSSGPVKEKEVLLDRPEGDLAEWPVHWLGYTSYNAVFVSAKDLEQMHAEVRAALWRYVECGGLLAVLGATALQPPGMGATAPDPQRPVLMQQVGFGRYYRFQATETAKLPPAEQPALLNASDQVGQPWRRGFGLDDGHRAFPVTDNLTMPTGAMFTFSILFALIVGPVNLLLLTRKNRRVWLLWTVPVISLVTFGVILAYSLVSEGITPTSRQAVLTLLDQSQKRAVTIGMLGYYSPLTLSAGLRFAPDAELTPFLERRWDARQQTRCLDWTSGQHWADGWVAARVPCWFLYRKNERRTERLEVRAAPDGRVTVLNGLGSDIARLWVVDARGSVHEARDIASGRQVSLPVADIKLPAVPADALQAAYAYRPWESCANLFHEAKTFDEAVRNPQAVPRLCGKQMYLALLRDSPFVETALARRSTQKQEAIVLGWYEEGEVAP